MYNTRTKRPIGIIEILIIINVIIFIPRAFPFLFAGGKLSNSILEIGALIINAPLKFCIERGSYWQLLTAMFIHGNFSHLFFNMYALFLFGKPLELRWGKGKFLAFYLTVGILANIASVFFLKLTTVNPVYLIGASGAIFGVLLAFGGYYPDVKLLLFFVIPMRVKWVIVLYTVLELIFEASGTMSSIAHYTHLFGFLFAFLYLLVIFKTNPIKEMFFTERDYFVQ